MENRITQTINFLRQQFDTSEYYKEHEEEKNYRLEHTMRVANIGAKIAMQEGMNVEALVLGCLLHDLSYCKPFEGEEDWINHGRTAAVMARPFLKSLELSEKVVEEICYGIAIHVDDQAGYDGERTALAASIGDADNIDRFDVYRIYENFQSMKFDKMSLHNKLERLDSMLIKLTRYKEDGMSTETATEIWREKLTFFIAFIERMKQQLHASETLMY